METKERTIKIYSIEEDGKVLLTGKIDKMRTFAIDHFVDMVENGTYLELEDYPFSVESLEKDEDVVLQFIEFWGAEVSVVAEVSEKEFKN
jgi:hypothetical protein